jgi:pimeloyl-ACP methyl ester carboxylesterase
VAPANPLRGVAVVAALGPDRCTALVSVSAYLIGSQAANEAPLPLQAELAWWYQFYFATVPAITLEATPTARRTRTPAATPANSPESTSTGSSRAVDSIGHNLPQEALQAFAEAIIDAASY